MHAGGIVTVGQAKSKANSGFNTHMPWFRYAKPCNKAGVYNLYQSFNGSFGDFHIHIHIPFRFRLPHPNQAGKPQQRDVARHKPQNEVVLVVCCHFRPSLLS
jgi:hypothetical protein